MIWIFGTKTCFILVDMLIHWKGDVAEKKGFKQNLKMSV